MRATSFFYRHYLATGESFPTHAAAVFVGALMTTLGIALAATISFLPVGVVIGVLGLFIFGTGVFAHIQSPVRFSDLADSVIGLAGAAISLTLTLAAAFFLMLFGLSVIAALVEWIRFAF